MKNLNKDIEFVQKVNALIIKGAEKGSLTLDEIEAVFDFELTDKQIEEISVCFMKNNITIDLEKNDLEEKTKERNKTNELKFTPNENILKRYFYEVGSIPMLTFDEELELAKRIEKGDTQAKDILINSNLRLVISIAKKYINSRVPLEDLIQEGNLGLIKAIEKYDYNKGCKFSTYATWWIRQSITSAIAEKSKSIRLPTHITNIIRKYNKIRKDFFEKYQRDPTIEEVARELEISSERLTTVLLANKNILSLELPIDDEQKNTIADFLEDKKQKNPQDIVCKEMLSFYLQEVFSTLTEREQKVLEYRFGLNGHSPKTLEEIGKKINLTQERVRQIEKKALRKLRHPSRSRKIKNYYFAE